MEASTPLRNAEIIAALSLATDLGTGQPLERSLRTCLLAFRLAQHSGLSLKDMQTVYYVSLLRFVGCTADARHLMDIFGDELRAQAHVSTIELLPMPMLVTIVRYIVGQDYPISERLQRLTYGLKSGIARTREAEVAHCEVSQNIASRCGLGDEVQLALGQIYERWDGRGTPGRVKGEALSCAIRLVHIAQDVEVFYRMGGSDTAIHIVKKRAGGVYDPTFAARFVKHHHEMFTELESDSVWDTVLNIEPAPHLFLNENEVEQAMRAIADFTDLRSPFTHNHSSAVAELAFKAAKHYRLEDEESVLLRYAGYVHDLGRLAIPLQIWEKQGALTDAEFERIRLYPYYTERILSRSPNLRSIGTLAASHRERLDGEGYHRGIPASMLNTSARILAAADVFQSKLEPRPYRAEYAPEAAASEILAHVRSGKLDKQAVTAILDAASGKRAPARRARVANLSDREVEVLCLLAKGLTLRKIADHLGIAPKTADHHVQHIYNKIGVSTRAAATLFAMQNNLLDESSFQE